MRTGSPCLWPGAALVAVLAQPAPALEHPTHACDMDLVCIAFEPGFHQCAGSDPVPVAIAPGGRITLFDGTRLSSVVSFTEEDGPAWFFDTEPDSFDLTYRIRLSEYYTNVEVYFEDELRGFYQGNCGFGS